jgi:hypothetical protein
VISAGGCALRADLGTHTAGEIHLPSGQAINRDRSEVEILVVEQECTGGRDAAGRVEVIIEASPDQVRLVAAVQPLDGAQPCPDNPPTPVTVNLGEPLGDRTVVDAGRYPARRLQPYVDS